MKLEMGTGVVCGEKATEGGVSEEMTVKPKDGKNQPSGDVWSQH